jgi:hypothetical protein
MALVARVDCAASTHPLLQNGSEVPAHRPSATTTGGDGVGAQTAGGNVDGESRPFGNTGIVIDIAVDPVGNRLELIQRT